MKIKTRKQKKTFVTGIKIGIFGNGFFNSLNTWSLIMIIITITLNNKSNKIILMTGFYVMFLKKQF